MSSIYKWMNAYPCVADRCIDGIVDFGTDWRKCYGMCAVGGGPHYWLQLDFGSPILAKQVDIHGDTRPCCSMNLAKGYTIAAGNDPNALTSCVSTSAPSTAQVLSHPCSLVGRYVRITVPHNRFSFTEVTVHGRVFCNEGSYADEKRLTTSNQCDEGWYADEKGLTTCKQCDQGSYSDGKGLTACKQCDEGSYADDKGLTACKQCDQGSYSDGKGLMPCKQCDEGSYADEKGLTACKQCDEGSYADEKGLTACKQCDQGSYSEGSFANEEKSTSCHVCSAGSYAEKGASSCTACSEGSYADAKGAGSCISCPEGSYANQKNASTCASCSKGFYSKKGASSCVACPKGSYADEKGASSCEVCPEGFYADQTNASSCAPCSEGSYSQKGASSCTACPEGSYADEKGAISCVACSAGKYASRPGLTQCNFCPAGRHSGAGKSECTSCPRGTYGALFGQSECAACPAGKHGDTKGSNTSNACKECKDDGKYSPEAGAVLCQKCPIGQEPRVSGITCFIPDRFQLLVKLWIVFLPTDVMIVILVVVRLIWLQKVDRENADRDFTWKSRLWAMAVPPRFFGSTWKLHLWATAVLLWDIVDYCLFAWWYLDAKPGRNQAAEFEEDFLVAKVCCGVLWVGPCLPIAALVLSRKQYSFLQAMYDALELYLVYYTDQQYDFKAASAIATSANYWSSIVDGVIFKGPSFFVHLVCEHEDDDEFGGRLLDDESPPLEESNSAQQEAQQDVRLQVLSQQEASPLVSAAGGRSLDPEQR